MPNWIVPEQIYDLPRNIAFLDTNVLVSLANPNDGWHEQTIAALDMAEYRWAIALGSLIEAWNFLVGRARRKEFAYDLMTWILTPGNPILVGDAIEPVSTAHLYSQRYAIDLVDASALTETEESSASDMVSWVYGPGALCRRQRRGSRPLGSDHW